MYPTLRLASLLALVGYSQADFAVGTSASEMGIGELIPNTGGNSFSTTPVSVSYPGGCLDNVQQFKCVGDDDCLLEGDFEIEGRKTGDKYGFEWKDDGWEFSQDGKILGFCEKNGDEGCTGGGAHYTIGFTSYMLCTGSINSGFDD